MLELQGSVTNQYRVQRRMFLRREKEYCAPAVKFSSREGWTGFGENMMMRLRILKIGILLWDYVSILHSNKTLRSFLQM